MSIYNARRLRRFNFDVYEAEEGKSDMLRLINAMIVCFAVAAFVPGAIAQQGNKQQQTKELVSAPIPAQILNAKKVFISNEGEQVDPSGEYFGGSPNQCYNRFYEAIKNLGQYELVSVPIDADIIYGISHIEHAFRTMSGGKDWRDAFKLVVSDPKTHVVLWTLVEQIEISVLEKHRIKNFNLAMDILVEDLKKLTAQAAIAADKGIPR
jgi:hypothetical protein